MLAARTTTVPKYEYSIPEEAKYFVSIGVLPASAFDTTRMTNGVEYEINMDISKNGYLRIWATSGQLNTLVSYVTKANAGLSGDVSRLTFAKVICQLTGVSTSPDVSGYSGNLRTWADAPSSIVTEVPISMTSSWIVTTTNIGFKNRRKHPKQGAF